MNIKYLLTDLDGVIRKFPPERDQEIEKSFGLPQGILFKIAFEKNLLNKVVCGIISDENWRDEIVKNISKICKSVKAIEAVKVWSQFPGVVDENYLDYINTIFSRNSIVLLTNGTSKLNLDLSILKIDDRFFKIFNSADIGICKPDKKIFEHILQKLGCLSSEILFVDDSQSHIQTASELGFLTHHYKSLKLFKKYLFQLSLDQDPNLKEIKR